MVLVPVKGNAAVMPKPEVVKAYDRQRPTAFGVPSTLFGITGHDDLHSSVTGNIDFKDFLGAQAP